LSIAVTPERRGCGIGGCLLAAMPALLRLEGTAQVSLSVESDNPALSLFRRVGFTPVGDVEATEGAAAMVRRLAPG
jgi:[ribosomal protein S18]-alanine N-acetyltransferase